MLMMPLPGLTLAGLVHLHFLSFLACSQMDHFLLRNLFLQSLPLQSLQSDFAYSR
jgi:hypothetical protein